jgi:hypothetical protein
LAAAGFWTPVVAIVASAWESHRVVLLAGFAAYVALYATLVIAGALPLRGVGEHRVARTRGEGAVKSAVCCRAYDKTLFFP